MTLFSFRPQAAAALGCLVLFLLPGCGREQDAVRPGEPTEPVPAETVPLLAPRPRSIEAAGSVAAEARLEIASRMAAYITELPLREGALVKKDDLLARLDARDILAAVHAAEGKLAAAEAALRDAALDDEKIGALYREGLTSENSARKASLKREAARSDLSAAQGAVNAAHAQLAYAEVRAPADGRIVRVLKRAGDMAVPGLPLMVIDSEGAVKFEFRVPQSAAVAVRPGVSASVTLDGVREPFAVKIEEVSESADPVSRTYFARASFLPGAEASARPGMFGRISIAAEGEPLRFVPEAALVRLGGLEGVFSAEPCGEHTCARFRWLRLGVRESELAQVQAGLEGMPQDAQLILHPAPGLADGARISVRAQGE